MQVADYLGQYANSLANAPIAAPSAKTEGMATQNLVSELTGMQEGAVFEGSINAVDGQKILLGLGNGQTIAARLEGSVNLMQGQSVFFQVKSNDGNTIAIKPFMGGQAFNPTIQKALDAAGMEMTKDTIQMVNRMMEEGMPIDRQSLAAMRHTLMQNPHVPLDTAVLMRRLGLAVNGPMAAQFGNYQSGVYSMLHEMEQVMEALPDLYAKASEGAKGLLQLNQQVLAVFNAKEGAMQEAGLTVQEEGDLPQGPANGKERTPAGGMAGAGTAQGLEADVSAAARGLEAGASGAARGLEADASKTAQGLEADRMAKTAHASDTDDASAAAAKLRQEQAQAGRATGAGQEGQRPVSELFNKHQLAQLEAQLREVLQEAGDFKLNAQLTAKEALDAIARQLEQQPSMDKAALGRLFSGKEYHTLLKEVMQEQWTLKPEELKIEHKVEELFQRLNRQMGQLEQLARQGGNTSQLSQAAAQVRDNIEFMHQVNQAYTYVQLPLKMANQNAHGDLYVYTNKRNLGKKEGELSAFLHLELENLGTTDVSVKMLDKNVSTKFYLEDDAAYGLIEKHLPALKERLEKLGYRCSVTVENREQKVDFVEDFLQKSQPAKAASRGMVHRYSFDVRA